MPAWFALSLMLLLFITKRTRGRDRNPARGLRQPERRDQSPRKGAERRGRAPGGDSGPALPNSHVRLPPQRVFVTYVFVLYSDTCFFPVNLLIFFFNYRRRRKLLVSGA